MVGLAATTGNAIETGPGYVSPKSDGDYKSPETGQGYVKIESDNSYKSPQAGAGYVAPKSDSGYKSPETGPGYQKPGTYNASNETVEIKNDLPANKTEPAIEAPGGKPIDELLAGTWRAYSDYIYYKDGDFKYRITPESLLNIHKDSRWEFGGMAGTVSVVNITKDDWSRWGISAYGPTRKIVFSGWQGAAEGPIEESIGAIDFIWAIYNSVLPGEEREGSVWLKFGPAGMQKIIVESAGPGRVVSQGNEINCGETCTAEFLYGKEVMLTAIPEGGSSFKGWVGQCTGTDPSCILSATRPQRAVAIFGEGCETDDECPLDQTCSNGECSALACECGYAKDHACQKYECCSDTKCGVSKTCDTAINKCVLKSACREVSIKGDPADKHDVVIVGDGFKDYDQLEKGINLLMDFQSESGLGVFSVSPFKENRNKFNVWMVMAPDYGHHEEPSPLGGNLVIPEAGDYERFVRTCNRDTVIVLSASMFRPWARFPTSGSSGGVVYMSLDNPLKGPEYFGRTLLHEMGQAIGGLGDEYVDYNSPGMDTTGLPNCASSLDEAEQKWGDLLGVRGVDYYTGIPDVPGTKYYKKFEPTFPELGFFPDGSDFGDGGCAFELGNIRPTETSIMKDHYTFDNDFGPVNERVLAEKLEDYNDKLPTQNIEPQGTRGRRFREDAG
ncbi:MAG: hypothetical protein HYW27_00645 [Candidatus Aenigmarchaeota archaeon]|nr:hypothetical protein [Candidatus Aenigmarchaeota archaeon]